MNNQSEKTLINMHTHTERLSDAWDNLAVTEIWIIWTEHNIANDLKWSWPAWMEVNCIDQEDNNRVVHLLYYAKEYNDDLLQEAEQLRDEFYIKCQTICANISRDFELWIKLDIDNVVLQAQQPCANINSMHIVKTLINDHQKEVIEILNEKNPQVCSIFKRIIHPNAVWVKPIGIEPKLLVQFAEANEWIVSFAHPQVTFRDKEPQWFRNNGVEYCRKHKIRAIEMPLSESATKDWTEAIRYVATEGNLNITFGGDYHWKELIDKNHAKLRAVNPHIEYEWAMNNIMKYNEQIWLILPEFINDTHLCLTEEKEATA